jgi:hypothetical protein
MAAVHVLHRHMLLAGITVEAAAVDKVIALVALAVLAL